ncbi:MAG: YlxR family protein [Salinibacterium sp.]|nr:YlxR family protein [Salinibacterium sp.]
MEPVRTCLGCRQRADTSTLLRIVASGGEVFPDPSATLPGRGAWVHPNTQCVETAIKRRAFGRAFRVTEALDTSRLVAGAAQDSAHNEHANEQAD